MANRSLSKETPELNTLKVLLQSLENQFQELDSVNENIDKLEAELKGGINQEEKREKRKNFIPGQEKNSILGE
ncbi:hypothetical protein ES705_08704 [subsurface metagenome]